MNGEMLNIWMEMKCSHWISDVCGLTLDGESAARPVLELPRQQLFQTDADDVLLQSKLQRVKA